MSLIGLSFLGIVNVLTIACFYYDKSQAKSGGWRISEKALLSLALVGGSPAAKLAQYRFRHKTRKQPFATVLNLIMLGHILVGLVFMQPNLIDKTKQAILSF